jgi:hypothetical protein
MRAATWQRRRPGSIRAAPNGPTPPATDARRVHPGQPNDLTLFGLSRATTPRNGNAASPAQMRQHDIPKVLDAYREACRLIPVETR